MPHTRIIVDQLPGDVLDRLRPVAGHLLLALPLPGGRVGVQRGRGGVGKSGVGHETYQFFWTIFQVKNDQSFLLPGRHHLEIQGRTINCLLVHLSKITFVKTIKSFFVFLSIVDKLVKVYQRLKITLFVLLFQVIKTFKGLWFLRNTYLCPFRHPAPTSGWFPPSWPSAQSRGHRWQRSCRTRWSRSWSWSRKTWLRQLRLSRQFECWRCKSV